MKALRLVSIAVVTAASALAADPSPKPDKRPEVAAQERAKMADAHERMAVCLRSDKPLSVCHQEMMNGCSCMEGNACPVAGGKSDMKHHCCMMHPERSK